MYRENREHWGGVFYNLKLLFCKKKKKILRFLGSAQTVQDNKKIIIVGRARRTMRILKSGNVKMRNTKQICQMEREGRLPILLHERLEGGGCIKCYYKQNIKVTVALVI